MKKTFLEWSVADKKEQREKFIKQMLSTPTRWVPDFPRYNHIGSNISLSSIVKR